VNHIATGRALSPGEEELLLIIGDSKVAGDGSEVDEDGGDGDEDRWRWLRGHFSIPAGCRNRDFYSPKFINGGGGATELLLENCRLP
jgi:hypothetical protein